MNLIWINSRQMSRKPTAGIQFRRDFWTETDKLKGKHVGNMLSGRWRRSSVSAAAYSSTLTTELLLCSDQILTRLTASLHVTYDSSTDLSTDKSQNVKTEVKKVSFSVTTLCLCIRFLAVRFLSADILWLESLMVRICTNTKLNCHKIQKSLKQHWQTTPGKFLISSIFSWLNTSCQPESGLPVNHLSTHIIVHSWIIIFHFYMLR